MFSHITIFPSRRIYKFTTADNAQLFAELFDGYVIGKTNVVL